MTSNELSILADELRTDPRGIGYASMSDFEVSVAMNNQRFSLPSPDMSGNDLNGLIDKAEVNPSTTNATVFAWLGFLTSDGAIAIGSSQMQTALLTTFPAGTYPKTNTAISRAATVPASRFEVLFGIGGVCRDIDVNEARKK